jgi:hypothetical protein
VAYRESNDEDGCLSLENREIGELRGSCIMLAGDGELRRSRLILYIQLAKTSKPASSRSLKKSSRKTGVLADAEEYRVYRFGDGRVRGERFVDDDPDA